MARLDDSISRFLPANKIGADQSGWIGIIEGKAQEDPNNKGGYRYKVRIIGDNPADFDACATTTKDITFTLLDSYGGVLDQCASP